MTDQPVWRIAAKDDAHPLHSATWLIFGKSLNLKLMDRKLAEQREDVIAYCKQILDADELYDYEGFGNGLGPAHAAGLLLHWKVMDELPRIIALGDDQDADTYDDYLMEIVWDGVRAIGDPAVDPLVDYIEGRANYLATVTTIGLLSDIGRKNARAYDCILAHLEIVKNDWDVRYVVENLLICDPDKAIPYLEQKIAKRKFTKELRDIFKNWIEDARNDTFIPEE